MSSSQDAAEIILAMDIGGTAIKSAVFQGGKILRKLPQIPSCSNGSHEEIVSSIQRTIHQAGTADRIAVSIPGPFDYRTGRFLMDHKFAAVKDCLFSEIAGNTPACFIHDANAFLLGEQLYGAARGYLRVGGITLGTGVGAAFSIGGDLQNNPLGSPAKQVSLWNIPYRDGIAEDYISVRTFQKRFPDLDAKVVAEAAVSGNIQAQEAWKEYSRDLYLLLETWQQRLSPEVIVLGGQLRKGLFLGEPIPAGLNIRFSELGEEAALWGAYEYARRAGNPVLTEPSEEQLHRAIISTGNPSPYQQFLNRAEKGENLTVGVLGGSITSGAACPFPEKRYHGILLDFLRKQYPQSCFSLVNAGIGATDSIYGAFRAERDLLSRKPDLVILEFAVNDTDESSWAKSYEGVVRQILKRGCALILLFMTHNHQRNCQRFQEVIGRHYNLAMVSFHDSVMPELMNGHILWDEVSNDEVHPNTEAHTFTGKLLCGLLTKISGLPIPEVADKYMPEKLFSDEFEHPFLLERNTFQPEEKENWEKIPEDDSRGYSFRSNWVASIPGSRMSFSFTGKSLWISYLGIDGPVGRISVQVDQAVPVMLDSYFPHEWNGTKQFWKPVISGLTPGRHHAVITLLEQHHPNGGTVFYFCGAAGINDPEKETE